jgi:hypothetical protein
VIGAMALEIVERKLRAAPGLPCWAAGEPGDLDLRHENRRIAPTRLSRSERDALWNNTMQFKRSMSELFVVVQVVSPGHSFPPRFQRGDPHAEIPDLRENVATYLPRRQLAGSL